MCWLRVHEPDGKLLGPVSVERRRERLHVVRPEVHRNEHPHRRVDADRGGDRRERPPEQRTSSDPERDCEQRERDREDVLRVELRAFEAVAVRASSAFPTTT